MHDELGCITDAAAMWQTILDDADQLAEHRANGDPQLELRDRLPVLLAELSPSARAVIRDHAAHVAELVAFVHRLEQRTGTSGTA